MPQPANLELYKEHFYDDEDVMKRDSRLLPAEVNRIIRCRGLYSYWKRYPSLTPKAMIAHDRQENPDIKERQAYYDIWIIKQILGAFEKDTKDWHLYNFNKEMMRVYHAAMESMDYKSAERALADYAKFNQLDKGEELNPRWEDIMPQLMQPTSDPSVIGLKPLDNLKELKEKYIKDYSEDIQDASYEEVTVEAKKTGEIKEEEK